MWPRFALPTHATLYKKAMGYTICPVFALHFVTDCIKISALKFFFLLSYFNNLKATMIYWLNKKRYQVSNSLLPKHHLSPEILRRLPRFVFSVFSLNLLCWITEKRRAVCLDPCCSSILLLIDSTLLEPSNEGGNNGFYQTLGLSDSTGSVDMDLEVRWWGSGANL